MQLDKKLCFSKITVAMAEHKSETTVLLKPTMSGLKVPSTHWKVKINDFTFICIKGHFFLLLTFFFLTSF